jgi:hypothetical protein
MENPFEELAALIREVKEDQQIIKSKLEKLELKNDNSEELLTRFEKAEQLKVSLPTLRNWEIQGIIQPVRKGRKVFFKKLDSHPKSKSI